MIPGESEVLLPPNTRITVESTYCAGNGLLLVNASEVPTECMLAALEIAEAAEAAEAEQAKAQADAARKAAARKEALEAYRKAKAEAVLKEAADAERKAKSNEAADAAEYRKATAEAVESERNKKKKKNKKKGLDADRRMKEAEAGEAERSEEAEADRRKDVEAGEAGEAERSEEVEAGEAGEAERSEEVGKEVEATKKAKRRRFITVCVVLARIALFVTRVTLIGAGKAVWLLVRLVSFVVQWLFESDERGHGDRGDRTKRGSGGLRPEANRRETREADRRKKAGETDRGELVTPSLVSAMGAAIGGLAVIIAAAHLLTRLREYRERRAFVF
jgi:hypothetical protein